MPRAPIATAALLLVAGLLWSCRLVFGESTWASDAAALVAATNLILTSIVVVATLLNPARWVRTAATALGAAWAWLAVVHSVDALWIAAVAASALTLLLTWSRWTDAWYTGTFKPDRVPARATTLTFGLLVVPGVIGALSTDGVEPLSWVLAGVSVVAAVAYARASIGALWLVRTALPVLAVAAAVQMGLIGGLVIVAAIGALTWLAWTSDARLAAEPLLPKKVDSVSILPEMVPQELMESAGYDRKGKPTGGNSA